MRLLDEPRESTESDPLQALGRWASLVAALACALFVLLQLRPDLLVLDTTPSGGDMGAHVWGPAYMRDHLLSDGRLTGWTPDWYAGFPAYHYYMILPPLAIIVVNAGLTPWLGLPVAGVVLAATWFAARRPEVERQGLAGLVYTAGIVLAAGAVFVPYGVSFKLVSVAGLVVMPVAGWAMAKLFGAVEPIPALVAVAVTVFLFDTNFNIYGGNIASTLAGEFAFAISLSLTLLSLGWMVRSMDTGRYRASTAVLLAAVALTHVIPLIFAMVVAALLLSFVPGVSRRNVLIVGAGAALFATGLDEGLSTSRQVAALAALPVIVAALAAQSPRILDRVRTLATAGPAGALISAIWLFPFSVRSDYFNDMGWERLDDYWPALLTTPMRWALPVAGVGALLAFAFKDRLGMLFTVVGLTCALGVANFPDGKLWNARILPFYYLSVYLVAAVGVALLARVIGAAVSERLDAPHPVATLSLAGGAMAVALVGISFTLQNLPFGGLNDEGTYEFAGIEGGTRSFIPSWVTWNYSGYEEKRSYAEYAAVVDTMTEVGRTNGCGRAMWEYSSDLDRYGTPMALMLLPHWTDGCIASMEGLYFESSASTPFHFLNQSTLSVSPSRAQRDLPYQDFDIDRGVAQLQTSGVRYYLAQDDEAITAADDHPDLTRIAESQPFVIYEVAGSSLVEPLAFEPVVASGPDEDGVTDLSTRFDVGWESQAVRYYNDPGGFNALPAQDGPDRWERVTTLLSTDGAPAAPVEVSELFVGRNSISFEVDQPGTPVLVKMSYFPNWSASGADGPYRAGPNLMVVVPTDTRVELSYDYTWVEYVSFLLFALGCAAAVVLARDDARARWLLTARAVDAPGPHIDGDEDDDALDERLQHDLFARLLAETDETELVAPPAQVDEQPNVQVGIADRMLGALEDRR